MAGAVDWDKISDEELVKLTLKNQEIFLYLIRRYEKKLWFYILRITSVRPEEAEDILQEVFIKAYLNLNNFDTSLRFSSWIYRIAHNEVISQYRKKQSRPQTVNLDIQNGTWQNLATDLNLEKQTDQSILKQQVQQLLASLDIKYREVLILKFIEDKSYQEISDILKKPLGTVASLINRAKEQLRNNLNHSLKL